MSLVFTRFCYLWRWIIKRKNKKKRRITIVCVSECRRSLFVLFTTQYHILFSLSSLPRLQAATAASTIVTRLREAFFAFSSPKHVNITSIAIHVNTSEEKTKKRFFCGWWMCVGNLFVQGEAFVCFYVREKKLFFSSKQHKRELLNVCTFLTQQL